MLTQPTPRYHGNVSAFMAEVRGRVQGGDQVMMSAASTGEMERFADHLPRKRNAVPARRT